MSIFILLLAFGLAMDSFAVSIANGMSVKKIRFIDPFKIAFAFGAFQALMPLLGWYIGNEISSLITSFDHWIAFFLLLFIGIRMIRSAFEKNNLPLLDNRTLLVQSFATSIDAAAAGISLRFLNYSPVPTVITIGVVTFSLSLLGVLVGKKFGCFLKNKSDILGGIILILIGVKVLIEHLF